MADEQRNAFNASLLKEKLRLDLPPLYDPPPPSPKLTPPKLGPRGLGPSARPTLNDRGLTLTKATIPGDKPSLSSPEEFLKELTTLQGQGLAVSVLDRFSRENPANVSRSDLAGNDWIFRGQAAPVAAFFSATARKFGISRGLLAEHFVAESNPKRLPELLKVPRNATLSEYLSVAKGNTTDLGLDNYVSDIGKIRKVTPKGVSLSGGTPIPDFAAESAVKDAIKRGASSAEIEKLRAGLQRPPALGPAWVTTKLLVELGLCLANYALVIFCIWR